MTKEGSFRFGRMFAYFLRKIVRHYPCEQKEIQKIPKPKTHAEFREAMESIVDKLGDPHMVIVGRHKPDFREPAPPRFWLSGMNLHIDIPTFRQADGDVDSWLDVMEMLKTLSVGMTVHVHVDRNPGGGNAVVNLLAIALFGIPIIQENQFAVKRVWFGPVHITMDGCFSACSWLLDAAKLAHERGLCAVTIAGKSIGDTYATDPKLFRFGHVGLIIPTDIYLPEVRSLAKRYVGYWYEPGQFGEPVLVGPVPKHVKEQERPVLCH